MSVKHFKNGKLNLVAGGASIGGGTCDCENKVFTGTAAEVEQAIADGVIKDDYIVNITDDVTAGAADVDVLDSYEEIMANTEAEKAAGALGVKEGFEAVKNSTLSTLEDVEASTDPKTPVGAGAIKELTNKVGDIRYNAETDNIEIFFDGIWNVYKGAGIQHYIIFEANEVNNITYDKKIYSSGNGGSFDVSIANNTLAYQRYVASGSMASDGVFLAMNTNIDLSKYSKVVCSYSYNSIPQYDSVFVILNSLSSQTFSHSVPLTRTTNITEVEIDLTAVNSGHLAFLFHAADINLYKLKLFK